MKTGKMSDETIKDLISDPFLKFRTFKVIKVIKRKKLTTEKLIGEVTAVTDPLVRSETTGKDRYPVGSKFRANFSFCSPKDYWDTCSCCGTKKRSNEYSPYKARKEAYLRLRGLTPVEGKKQPRRNEIIVEKKSEVSVSVQLKRLAMEEANRLGINWIRGKNITLK